MAPSPSRRDRGPGVAAPPDGDAAGEPRPPLHPHWVLLVAIVLPAVGQLINGTPRRAVMFLFFMLTLGWVTLHLAPPQASFVGRHAGGFFVYAISILDAYRWARWRWEVFHAARRTQNGDAGA